MKKLVLLYQFSNSKKKKRNTSESSAKSLFILNCTAGGLIVNLTAIYMWGKFFSRFYLERE